MSDAILSFIIGIVIGAAIVLVLLGVANLPDNSLPMPVTGRVLEKTEVSTGYNRTVYTLKLEVANDRYLWVATDAKTWHVIIVGVNYEFTAGDGSRYIEAKEVTRE